MPAKTLSPLLVTIVLAAAAVAARAETPLALEQALERLVERSVEIRHERERVIRSEALLQQARGANDWNLELATDLTRRVIPRDRNGLLTTDTRTDSVLEGSLGVRRQFRNGVVVTPHVRIVENLDNDDDDPFSETTTLLNVSVRWPLLRDGGVEAAAVHELVAESNLHATRHGADHAVARAVHRAVSEFWRCLAAARILDVLTRMEGTASDFESVISRLADAGELSPLTRERVRVELALRQLDLDTARTSLFDARHRLAFALGDDQSDEAALPLAGDRFPTPDDPGNHVVHDRSALVELALANRADLRALEQQRESHRSRLDAAENALLPALDLNFAVDRVGIVYSQSLDNRSAKGRVSEQRSRVHGAEMDIRRLESRIRLEVGQALHHLGASERAFARTRKTVGMLEDVIRETRRRVTSGEAPADELFNAEDKLTVATLKAIRSELAYALAVADLRLVTGTARLSEDDTPAALAERFKSTRF